MGLSNIRSDKNAEADSFGLVALCSIGPILAVLLLGLFSGNQDAVVEISAVSCRDTVEIGRMYLREIPTYLWEMAVSMAPIVVIFLVFQWLSLRLSGKNLLKICFGILSTYMGAGAVPHRGQRGLLLPWGRCWAPAWPRAGLRHLMIPWPCCWAGSSFPPNPPSTCWKSRLKTSAPAPFPAKPSNTAFPWPSPWPWGFPCCGARRAFPSLWFLIPGYALAILLSFRVPDIYTAIAFDSGGVASGPMTATFMLQFFIGASTTLGGNALRDAFGVVAMVAMMPLISIQVMGVIYGRKSAKTEAPAVYGDYEIIELWEGNE